jgi:hypothetical protein
VLAGETDPKEALAELLADPAINGIIAGAGGVVDEVDGAISYFQNLIATRRRIAMLAVGYGASQNPGSRRWRSGFAPLCRMYRWSGGRFTTPPGFRVHKKSELMKTGMTRRVFVQTAGITVSLSAGPPPSTITASQIVDRIKQKLAGEGVIWGPSAF